MGLIKANIAEASSEFVPVEPGTYTLTVADVKEVEKDDEVVGYRVKSKIDSVESGNQEMLGKTISDYIHVAGKEPGTENEFGLGQLKRYFESCFGKADVATWTNEDFDTDRLVGQSFRGQVVIDSFTKQGETEPRLSNKFKRMESL